MKTKNRIKLLTTKSLQSLSLMMQALCDYCNRTSLSHQAKTILALFFMLSSTIVSGQTLRTFNGVYDDGTAMGNGRATYTYYEDKETSEYIKHGAFRYTYHERDNTSSTNRTVTGSYNRVC